MFTGPKKILITDALSSIGQAILAAFEHSPYAILTPTTAKLDWFQSDENELGAYLKRNDVAIIINTLGWHEEPDSDASDVLVKAADKVASVAAAADIAVIHLSSYRVFGGENKSSYDEQDPPSPLSAVGRAFLSAEQSMARYLKHYICLRLSWVMDPCGESRFGSLLSQLTSEGEPMRVTHQRRGAPVSAVEVGYVIVAMVNQILCGSDNWGVFHLASGDICTSAEFVEALADAVERENALQRQWLVEPLTDEQLEKSQEPDSSVLLVHRCRDCFGYQVRSWRHGLTQLVRAWLGRHQLMASEP